MVEYELIAGVGSYTLFYLIVIAFFAGIGITALGPGGVFLTIGLYLFTPFRSETVVGTAIVTHIATGVLGSLTYLRSGELLVTHNQRIALLLSVTSMIGVFVGVRANSIVSEQLFGFLLGGFIVLTGLLVWSREQYGGEFWQTLNTGSQPNPLILGIIGFGVSIPSGLFGVGGPILAVPLLVMIGVPLLPALAVAQVQSIFIAGFGTVGYLARDAVSLPLAVLVGIPELVGSVVGWKIAQTADERRLKLALAIVLIVLGLYLPFHS